MVIWLVWGRAGGGIFAYSSSNISAWSGAEFGIDTKLEIDWHRASTEIVGFPLVSIGLVGVKILGPKYLDASANWDSDWGSGSEIGISCGVLEYGWGCGGVMVIVVIGRVRTTNVEFVCEFLLSLAGGSVWEGSDL